MPVKGPPESSFILCRTEAGQTWIQCRFKKDTIWLSQALMAELRQTTPQNVTPHVKAIYAEGEVVEAATCKESLQVCEEGGRQVTRKLRRHSQSAIRAVGYRMRSPRGTQPRQWIAVRIAETVRGLPTTRRGLPRPLTQPMVDPAHA